MIGVNKAGGTVDMGMLEFAIREDLNIRSPRAMCVMRPLKITLTNYPADKTETLVLPVHPQKSGHGQPRSDLEPNPVYSNRPKILPWKRRVNGSVWRRIRPCACAVVM